MESTGNEGRWGRETPVGSLLQGKGQAWGIEIRRWEESNYYLLDSLPS